MLVAGPRIRVLLARAAQAAAAGFFLFLLSSCGGLGGGGSSPPVPYEEVRGNLERAYNALNQAVGSGAFDRVPQLGSSLGAELDRAEAAAKPWGILEREKMNLALASARRGLKEVVRTAPATADPEFLRALLRPVGEGVQQALGLLDQAAAASKSPS